MARASGLGPESRKFESCFSDLNLILKEDILMTTKITPSTSGISLSTVLFLIFLVLKLTHTINWSWWWVCAPIWAGPALILAIIIIGALLSLFTIGISKFASLFSRK